MQVVVRNPADIGTAIRQRREAQGLDQLQLAEKAGVSARQVGRLELHGATADPKLSTLRAVARVLRLTFILEPDIREVASGE